jgi:hypothetical protein
MTISRNLSKLADNLTTNGTFTDITYTGILSGGTGVVNFGSGQIYKDATGNLGIGTTTPATKLDVVGPAGVTSFTGTTKLGVIVRGSTAATDYSGIDFTGNGQTNPTARIAVLTTGGGASLVFGTSATYTSGITNAALTLTSDGVVRTLGRTQIGKTGSLEAGVGIVLDENGLIRTHQQASYQPNQTTR